MGQAAQDLLDGTCDPSGEWNYEKVLPRECFDDSTEGETWAKFREANKLRKTERYDTAKKLLSENDIPFTEFDSMMLRVMEWDFWPTTGTFMHRKTRVKGKFTTKLISIIKKNGLCK